MRSKFPGYFKLTKAQIDRIWEEGILTLDANILLNFYRYSEQTRRDYLKAIADFQDRIWLTNQAAFEFLSNRTKVISEQLKLFDDFKTQMESTKATLNSSRGHPFVSAAAHSALDQGFDFVKKEIDTGRSAMIERLKEDDILNDVAKVFNNKVGNGYPDDALRKLFDHGLVRYKEKIPPGYKDISKDSQGESFSDKRRVFGDYIIWREVIDFAKEKSTDVILVTDDEKEDWWLTQNGQKISARPELFSEFSDLTGKNIAIYNSEHFLEIYFKKNPKSIERGSVEEVKFVDSDSKNSLGENIFISELVSMFSDDESRILNDRVNLLKLKRINMKNRIDEIRSTLSNVDSSNPSNSREFSSLLQEKRNLELRCADIDLALQALTLEPPYKG